MPNYKILRWKTTRQELLKAKAKNKKAREQGSKSSIQETYPILGSKRRIEIEKDGKAGLRGSIGDNKK